MRISTTMFQQQSIASILDTASTLQHTQNQLATGKRVITPSDDPAAASRVLQLQQAITSSGQYQSNGNAATARLNLEDSALSSTNTLLTNVRNLALQANNPGLADSDRKSIAVQIRQDFNQLVSLSNTQDANGEYLFAGDNTKTQPFTVNANQVTYHGDQGSRSMQIGSSDEIATGDSGWNVFMNIPTGNTNGVFVTSPGAHNSGSASIDTGSVVDSNAWVPGTYSISFPTSSSYEVHDQTGALVTNGTYTSGSPIAFRGIQTSISGKPGAGDNFSVSSIGASPNNTGTGIMSGSTVVDSSALQPNVYTVSFSASNNYDITDNLGKVVGTGTYQSGQPITVNGIQTSIQGAPQAGDSFVIAPPAQQDVFATINTLASTLENATGPQAASTVANVVTSSLQNLDSAQARIADTRSAVGARLNRITSAQDSENYFSLQLTSAKSTLQDVDYTTAVSSLNLQTVGLQAAQQAYVKISGLSLFSHMG